MNIERIKERIKAVLELSRNPNENEAKAAMLKAKEMMAKYKISEAELGFYNPDKVIDLKTEYVFTTRTNAWVAHLIKYISENYRCMIYTETEIGKQKRTIVIRGYEDDVNVCKAIIDYAVVYVNNYVKHTTKGATYAERTIVFNSYGLGFACGIRDAFNEQNKKKSNEWGLVMVTPDEVKDLSHLGNTTKKDIGGKSNLNKAMYNNGYESGKKFDSSTKLKA